MVQLLLSQGADATIPGMQKFTALHHAALSGSLELVDLLLREGKADSNAIADFKQPSGTTSLTVLHAALQNSHAFEVISLLLKWGAIPEKSLLPYISIHCPTKEIIELLLSFDLDVITPSRKREGF